MRIGVLIDAGRHPDHSEWGMPMRDYVMCCDCKTTFRVVDGTARCNGQEIVTCPWCGPDSGVNRLARGTPERPFDACQPRSARHQDHYEWSLKQLREADTTALSIAIDGLRDVPDALAAQLRRMLQTRYTELKLQERFWPTADWYDEPDRYVFLGSEVNPHTKQKYDFYVVDTGWEGSTHPGLDWSPTARFGPEPPDYASEPLCVSYYDRSHFPADSFKKDFVWGMERARLLGMYYLITKRRPLLEA